MCGIFGVVGAASAGVQQTLDALCRLESRGYDSTGIGTVHVPPVHLSTQFLVYRVVDTPRALRQILSMERLAYEPLAVIGHNRWASRGVISLANAHPHRSARREVMLVHNGDLDNHEELRAELQARGIAFASETDTEVIANLLEDILLTGTFEPTQAIQALTAQLVGSYALVISFARWPGQLFAVRCGRPLVIGLAEGATYASSEAEAILPHTGQLVFLQDQQIARVNAWGFVDEQVDFSGESWYPLVKSLDRISLGEDATRPPLGSPQSMLYEIEETPRALQRCIANFTTEVREQLSLMRGEDSTRRILLTGCGSAFHAALFAAKLAQQMPGLERLVEAQLANEFEPMSTYVHRDLLIAVSQSGGTADVMELVQRFLSERARVIGVVNKPFSELAQLATQAVLLQAGLEDGVAATKTFVTQCLALRLVLQALHTVEPWDAAYEQLPDLVERTLAQTREQALGLVATTLAGASRILCLGQQEFLPMAMEAALKIQEIAYLDAHAFSTSALKHGPLALVDKKTAVLAFLHEDERLATTALANLSEIQVRVKVPIICIGSQRSVSRLPTDLQATALIVPTTEAAWQRPLLQIIPVQLAAYQTAVLLGYNPSRPRHLAKQVTIK